MASLLFLMSTQLLGANPVGWPKAAGMADTNVHYFNGTFLAFATHDYSPQVCDVHRPHHHCARGGGSVPFLHVYTPHRCWRLSRTYTKRTSTLHGALHMLAFLQNTGFLMKDWWVWSSGDLVDWQLESIVQPNVSVPWSTQSERQECWATDAAFANNRYYFYLSVGPV